MEKDDEVKGSGNSLNYKFRMYDPRLGRFFAVDPIAKQYPMLTPYQHSSLNPIWNIELEGLEGTAYTKVINNQTGSISLKVQKAPDLDKNIYYTQTINNKGVSLYKEIKANTEEFKQEFSEFGLALPSKSQILTKEITKTQQEIGKLNKKIEAQEESINNSIKEANESSKDIAEGDKESGGKGYVLGSLVKSIIDGVMQKKAKEEVVKLQHKEDSLKVEKEK